MKMRVRIDHQTYEVEIEDLMERPIRAKVDGEVFEVWPEEPGSPLESTLEQPPLVNSPVRIVQMDTTQAVLAPIPGVILSISVSVGDEVKYGQELCVLEAMKMKNAIRATHEGRIAAILIEVGETVGHNQVLMEYES